MIFIHNKIFCTSSSFHFLKRTGRTSKKHDTFAIAALKSRIAPLERFGGTVEGDYTSIREASMIS